MTNIKTVVLYARVSTLNGQNPGLQLNDLRAYAEAQGWSVVEEYVDRGISGAKTSRPELNRLMRDSLKGLRDFDAVLVWKLDRFGRNVQHVVNAVNELKEVGIAFVSMKDDFDLTTAAGKMMFHMGCVFAELEHDIMSERTRMGLRAAVAQGRKPGPKIKGQPSRQTLWRQKKRAQDATHASAVT
jgi:DNA invertase Pin-like site-specific DNA recombinase